MKRYLPAAALIAIFFFGATTAPSSRPLYTKNLDGSLVRIEGKSLIVRILGSHLEYEEGEVVTDDKTVFSIDNQPASLADLQPGMDITVKISLRTNGTHRQRILARGGGVTGHISNVGDHDLTLSIRSEGNEKPLTVPFDDRTDVSFMATVQEGKLIPARKGTVKDLEPGMVVRVSPPEGKAKAIEILPTQKP